MKKIIVFLGIVLTAGWMNSCTDVNSGPETQFVWKNQSDHQITLSSDRVYVFQSGIIKPDNTFTCERPYKGGESIWPLFYSLKVVFEDGIEVTYSSDYHPVDSVHPEGYNMVYDLTWNENYQFEKLDDSDSHIVFRWTYTFTNADYDAAKAYTQAQEE